MADSHPVPPRHKYRNVSALLHLQLLKLEAGEQTLEKTPRSHLTRAGGRAGERASKRGKWLNMLHCLLSMLWLRSNQQQKQARCCSVLTGAIIGQFIG